MKVFVDLDWFFRAYWKKYAKAVLLFLIIGVVYDRHHTRMVKYYSGLVHTMPLFTIIFLIFTR